MTISPEPKKLFGREKEIEYMCNTIYNTQSSITYIVGEAGIGKSVLLGEFYKRLESRNTDLLVGFYRNDEKLIGEPLSPIYPFTTVLMNLLDWTKRTEKPNEKIKGIMTRIEDGFVEFAKEKGSEMVGAILHDIAKKFGLEKTLEVVEPLVGKMIGSKSAVTLALYYAHEHSDEPVLSYVGVIQSLLEQFENRRLLLIFDHFESVRKSSIDFLLNFIKLMGSKVKFHIIISFKNEEQKWSDTVARELFEYARQHLDELGAKQVKLIGLPEESIGEWIKWVRKVNLEPDQLIMIKKHSAGLPLLLNEWISRTQTFDYKEINKDKLCSYVCMRRKGLSEDDDVILDKMAVLAQLPFMIKKLTQESHLFGEFATTVGIKIDHYPRFIERLVERGLFEMTNDGYAWFKHELIQMCLEERLRNGYLGLYQTYHSDAAS